MSGAMEKFKKNIQPEDLDKERIKRSLVQNNFSYSEIIALKNFHCRGVCGHDLSPVLYTVHIGYVPSELILGAGSLAYIADTLSRSPNMQERLTAGIAVTIQELVAAKGVMVVMYGRHYCMKVDTRRQNEAELCTRHTVGNIDRDAFMTIVK